jgi:hypothetical protein
MADPQKPPTSGPMGFAGFAALTSNVDSLVRGGKQAATRRDQSARQPHSDAAPNPVNENDASKVFVGTPSSPGTGRLWLWGSIGGIVLAVLIANSGNDRSPDRSRGTAPGPAVGGSAPVGGSPLTDDTEAIPPVGTDLVLGTAQLRYCLSEDVRLDAAKGAALTDGDIDRFNAMVVDYNSRCASFKYRPSVFNAIKAQVEAKKSSLEADGAARFRR